MLYKQAKSRIESAGHITIIGHLNPDADTLGTGLGLWWILKSLGKRVDIVYVSKPLPQVLSFLPGIEKIKHSINPKTDLLISVDCGSFDRLGIEKNENLFIINIDHHATTTGFGNINLVEPDFISASEVAFKLAKLSNWPIGMQSAVNFYAALLTDSGYFGYEGVNERVFEFARDLVALGAVPEKIARDLRENMPLCKIRLLPMVLETLTLYCEGKVAGLDVTLDMFAKSGASQNEAEDFVNYARSICSVEVGFLIREEENGAFKVSLRSKRFVDVSKIAVMFGGGGHIRAAGFESKERDCNTLKNKIISKIKEMMNETKRK